MKRNLRSAINPTTNVVLPNYRTFSIQYFGERNKKKNENSKIHYYLQKSGDCHSGITIDEPIHEQLLLQLVVCSMALTHFDHEAWLPL